MKYPGFVIKIPGFHERKTRVYFYYHFNPVTQTSFPLSIHRR